MRSLWDAAVVRLAGLLDRGFLAEAGWDPRGRVLRLPAAHRLLGRRACRVDGRERSARDELTGLGMGAEQIAAAGPIPADHCAVPGCRRAPTMRRHTLLCGQHDHSFRKRPQRSLEEFLASSRMRPLPPARACGVAACTRPADHAAGFCNPHYLRWRAAKRATPGLDRRWWQQRESGVAEADQVSLRALPARVVVEVLFGVQQRVRDGVRTTDVDLRVLCDALRRGQVASIGDDQANEIGQVLTTPQRSLLGALRRHTRLALADPDREQAKDVWELAVFGHRGTLSFTGIAQPWLARAAKRWAGEQLPRHRGSGAARVRNKINGLGLLSEYLGARPDCGLTASALGRGDIEGFLNRLAYLESTGASR